MTHSEQPRAGKTPEVRTPGPRTSSNKEVSVTPAPNHHNRVGPSRTSHCLVRLRHMTLIEVLTAATFVVSLVAVFTR